MKKDIKISLFILGVILFQSISGGIMHAAEGDFNLPTLGLDGNLYICKEGLGDFNSNTVLEFVKTGLCKLRSTPTQYTSNVDPITGHGNSGLGGPEYIVGTDGNSYRCFPMYGFTSSTVIEAAKSGTCSRVIANNIISSEYVIGLNGKKYGCPGGNVPSFAAMYMAMARSCTLLPPGFIGYVTPTAPTVTSFSTNPTAILPGSSSTLSWTSSDATKCFIDGIGDVSTNGTRVVSPTSTTQYSIVCSKGELKSTSKMVTIILGTIIPPPPSPPTPTVATFSASPTTINPGQSSTLSWTSNTTGCIINANGVNRTPDGTLLVFPTITTQYSIVCSRGGDFSEPKYVTVTVNNSVSNNQSSTLSELTKSRLNTWITKNVVAKSTTLTTANYIKFIETVISKLNIIKSNTPSSNKNKINTINYLVTELGKILNTLDDNSFLDSILN